MTRREALNFSVKATAVAIASWFAISPSLKARQLLNLRPPGALKEDEFLKKCIRCGLCVNDCPYDTLKLGDLQNNIKNGTPYFIPREIPCYMCEDIPCAAACPTGALDISKMVNPDKKLNINMSKMGVAVIDEKACIAFWDIRCDACYRACPLIDKAIKIRYKSSPNSIALSVPEVDTDVCTGCGKCEHACVTQKAAIFVLPEEIALGITGGNYLRGGVNPESITPQSIKQKKSNALNYLNKRGEF